MILASPLAPLENLLRSLLDFFHNSVGLPWGWSIVALTILVRICLVPLVVRQIHSMQNMQAHAPQMKEIQRKYKGDRQKMNEELMKFYKENNINPASSCLPLLAQFPIFISLFYVLREFAKNPPGGDLAWLGVVPSIADPVLDHWSGYLLLFIYAASQIASTFFMSVAWNASILSFSVSASFWPLMYCWRWSAMMRGFACSNVERCTSLRPSSRIRCTPYVVSIGAEISPTLARPNAAFSN